MQLEISKKTGVMPRTNGCIEDLSGNILYEMKPGKAFNLPSGQYICRGKVSFVKPLNYGIRDMPKREKNIKARITSIEYLPSIASWAFIHAPSGRISLDQRLLSAPKFFSRFCAVSRNGSFLLLHRVEMRPLQRIKNAGKGMES